ncbi:MAG: hypothetical protein ACI8QZ_004092 [Chlamydiales bacterium]|jgi:hypothetical protein
MDSSSTPLLQMHCRHLALIVSLCVLIGCGKRPSQAEGHEPGLVVVTETPVPFPNDHDFGKVRFGRRVEHTFVLHNGDPEPVTIRSLQLACHCTQVGAVVVHTPDGREIVGATAREPEIVVVPPGAELHLTLAVDTGILLIPNADKLSIVRMRTSSESTPFVTFQLKVTAQKLFQVSPAEVRMDEVPLNYGQTTVVRVLRGKSSFVGDIIGVASQGKFVQVAIDKDFHFEDPVWTLTLTVPPGSATGPFRDRIVLKTTDDEGNDDEALQRELPIPIHGHYVEDVRLYPRVFTFGRVLQGQAGLIDAYLRTLVPGARIDVLETEVLGPAAEHITVECKPRAEDSTGRSPVWDVFISADAKMPLGKFEGQVRFLLDDSQHPVIERPFRGEVVSADG